MSGQHPDSGFTLVEVLLVILVLAILTTIVVVTMTDVRSEASAAGCTTDRRVLYTAVEAFFAQREVDVIVPADGSLDGFEQTLVNERFLSTVSSLYDLDPAGTLRPAPSSSCAA